MIHCLKNSDIPIVRVMGREMVEERVFQYTHNISITSSRKNAEIQNLDGEVLFLEFDDTDYEFNGCMTDEQAKQIALFVKKNWNNGEQYGFVVNCDAGVSRSAGVATAILKYYFNDDSQIFNNYQYCPNILCYRKVLDALMEENNGI